MNGFTVCWQRDGQAHERETLDAMARALRRRGTPRVAAWHAANLVMVQSGRDGAVVGPARLPEFPLTLVGDVRLDARDELRASLGLRSGHASDEELVLQSYARWGRQCVHHLHGDFSFALWDERERTLFAARDRFGICPLYHAELGGTVLLGNTLASLLRGPGVSRRLRDDAIGDFLLFGYNLDLATTTFADVGCVPPAHVLVAMPEHVRLERYWQLPIEEELRLRRGGEYLERFRELLLQSVSDRMREPRVAVHLSGGLDSTSVAAAACQLRSRTGAQLQGLCSHFKELLPDQERHYAEQAAKALNLAVVFHCADGHALYDGQADGRLTPPEPCHAPFTLAVHQSLLRHGLNHGGTLLTGYGPDALLRGSSAHAREHVRRGQWGRLLVDVGRSVWWMSRPRLGLLSWWRGREGNPAELPVWIEPEFARRCNLAERMRAEATAPAVTHPLRPESYEELTSSFWPRLLETFDAGWTGIPLRVSHPYFDERLVNYLLAIPALPWCNNKLLARSALHGWLPNAILKRPKTHLADNPERVVVQRSTSAWVNEFRASAELSRYVVRERIPKLGQGEDASNVETHLLPLSLQLWLDHHELQLHHVDTPSRSEEFGHAQSGTAAREETVCQATGG